MFGNGSSSAVAVKKTFIQASEALQQKGWQLANFIIADRSVALQILGNALNKLQLQRSREAKRGYWRRKYLKGKITRIVRNEGDTLQWLIYFEAERYEKEQEQSGKRTGHEMVVRYIKHLVQVTTSMSSFYVNVGINRLLRNYRTPEVRQVYEWVTQHFPSNQEYRKVKAVLMDRLKRRFGGFLKASTSHYGELRFETSENQASWAGLVRECLNVFTPWSTDQSCQLLSSAGYRLDCLPREMRGKAVRGIEPDIIEVNRTHVFLHPTCYRHITEALDLDQAEDRLAVPRFFKTNQNGNANNLGCSPRVEPLTEQELRSLGDRLSTEAERRSRVKPKLLRICVDGTECARLFNRRGSESQCQIMEGASLIEVWTEDEGEDLPLALHLVQYTEWQGIAPAAATVDLGDGRELFLKITPEARTEDASYAVFLLQCRPVSALERCRELLISRWFLLYRLPKYALVALVILGIGWSIGRIRMSQRLSSQGAALERLGKELAKERATRASLEKSLETEQHAVEAYLLVPDESREGHGRDGDGTREPAIAFSPRTAQVILELPTASGAPAAYRAILRPYMESREMLVENFPNPADSLQDGHLKFVLPMSFVQVGKHYVVELNSMSSAGHSERIYTFTFYVSPK